MHRFVERLTVEIEEAGEKLIAVDITGNAMVRTIVGTLAEIGRGHRPVGVIDEVLAAQNRITAGGCVFARASRLKCSLSRGRFATLGSSAFGS